jgi:alkanesulfonate monooxygenase SsuD/methylene tetrahydromethanopterin reductase-like flavin-dependent oxidoreductase (luciferase family)
VICGIGLGYLRAEFEATGLDYTQREQICKETLDICRLVWSADHASYSGEVFSFEDITLSPKPVAPIPMEYGGSTPAGMRRAAQWTEGWQGARLPLKTLDKRLELQRKLQDESGKRIKVSIQPLVTVATSYDQAAARVPISDMGPSRDAARWWHYPPSGSFETIADLEGLNVVGTPDQVAEEVHKFAVRNVDEFILDLRLQFDDFDQALELFGTQVLPQFRSA